MKSKPSNLDGSNNVTTHKNSTSQLPHSTPQALIQIAHGLNTVNMHIKRKVTFTC